MPRAEKVARAALFEIAFHDTLADADCLREAQRHPERFESLQVRVCGWNVRFTNLRPEEQDMFIAKAEASR